MKKLKITLLLFALFCLSNIYNNNLYAQEVTDTSKDSLKLNQEAIYNRPFIELGKFNTAVGGYLEGNTNYFAEDGISEGFSMEMRRFNIFLYSTITNKIKFLSELEFEHGTEEIALETALLDFEFNPALNFRAGVLIPQIGLVNANHDSPNWEFIERPLSSTEIIPTTLSEIGFGVFGKFYQGYNVFSYDAYLVNGLQEGVILNEQGKTFIPAGKSEEMFGEDNNGMPMFNGRVAMANSKFGEVGLSYYGGAYNRFQLEGEEVDRKRFLHLYAFDFNTDLGKMNFRGELVGAKIDVPIHLHSLYGNRQWGGFAEVIYPLAERTILGFDNSIINGSIRLERADLNVGTFEEIPQEKGDENTGIAVGLSWRPYPGTLIRANYRYHWVKDLLGNPAARVAGFQFGIASYF